ncbi:unnamed protein product [Medioppia subpectinata]|uniref:Uncharacterized protein n=1 Tax=Medioppia subpectinata TaxID=1979941 RepID=A0A7R9KJN0_9ACAR|nr:unnamed protein product [Medioppia subpectinata]CAG2103402.1 unnamed protein product [Medioppia subpectinata]
MMPKWESTNIKVSDPSCVPDQSCGWDKEKTTLYFHNTTRHAFGDYRCKVDYWSDADMKAHEHDSHTSVTVGRKENGTFFITYNAEQHYSNRPLP